MSKIYRSLDLQPAKVTEVDLRNRPMGPQQTDRPGGGFFGFHPGSEQPEVYSEIERRERDSVHLIEEARRQAETIQRDAYRAGFEQGERAGEKLSLQKVEPVIKAFHDLMSAIENDREAIIQRYEQDLIKVAFGIALQVLKTTIELQPEVVADVVRSALARISKPQNATLLVSPYDRQLIEHQMHKLEGASWPPAWLTIQADESITRGGCRIMTDSGDIDATIETQLHSIRNLLWND